MVQLFLLWCVMNLLQRKTIEKLVDELIEAERFYEAVYSLGWPSIAVPGGRVTFARERLLRAIESADP